MPFPDELAWTCHICGRTRPDSLISVHKHDAMMPGGMTVTENVRYCNDTPECTEIAKTYHFIDSNREAEGTTEFDKRRQNLIEKAETMLENEGDPYTKPEERASDPPRASVVAEKTWWEKLKARFGGSPNKL